MEPLRASNRRASPLMRMRGLRDRCPVSSLLFLFLACQGKSPQGADVSDLRSFSGPYFSQEPPRDTARIFMPGIVTTHGRDGNITFLDEGRQSAFYVCL